MLSKYQRSDLQFKLVKAVGTKPVQQRKKNVYIMVTKTDVFITIKKGEILMKTKNLPKQF